MASSHHFSGISPASILGILACLTGALAEASPKQQDPSPQPGPAMSALLQPAPTIPFFKRAETRQLFPDLTIEKFLQNSSTTKIAVFGIVPGIPAFSEPEPAATSEPAAEAVVSSQPEESPVGEALPPSWPPSDSAALEQDRHRQRAEEIFERIGKATSINEPREIESSYRQILALPIPSDLQGRALLEFATYLDEKKINIIKAAVVYENYLALEPSSPRAPSIYLRLADIYGQIGAEERSLSCLYQVLSSSIRAGSGKDGENNAREAMLKIGNAHFESGQYVKAAGIYSRLKLLDLSPEDQAFVLFRAAELLFRTKEYDAAIDAGKQFLAEFPTSALVGDCHRLIVQSLDASGRQDEAIQVTLDILRAAKTETGGDLVLANSWKMKAGNDLANVLYARGEYLRALHIYQTLANLSNDPAWKLAVIYQIGLCFERLKEPRRALETYRYIANATIPAADPAKAPSSPREISLNSLKESAEWHARHIEWLVSVGTKLYPILAPKFRSAQSPPFEATE